jgi:glycogen synthase
MKVLMFGWEFPPHISGGLGTACFGLTKALAKEKVDVLFVVPKAYGDEEIKLISASEVVMPQGSEHVMEEIQSEIAHEEQPIKIITVKSPILPYSTSYDEGTSNIKRWNYQVQTSTVSHDKEHGTKYHLQGGYGPGLFEEVKRYATIGGEIAKQNLFDVIHAHDWLTFLAGAEAKKVSGKSLIVHVHATEYDRSGDKPNPEILKIEQLGMDIADSIITVSEWTKEILATRYNIPSGKILVVHNGIVPTNSKTVQIKLPTVSEQVVTFVGRITHQKGPQYFVEAAKEVLKKFPYAHFIMAGGGDLLPQMIEKVAHLRLSSHFHFTGFLKREQVQQVWAVSHVYVMPSVSEPFGITPLEAVQAGVPVIISNQSGVAEVMRNAIKIDFWNVQALTNAICSLLKHKSLSKTISKRAQAEVRNFGWDRSAKKIKKLYYELAK